MLCITPQNWTNIREKQLKYHIIIILLNKNININTWCVINLFIIYIYYETETFNFWLIFFYYIIKIGSHNYRRHTTITNNHRPLLLFCIGLEVKHQLSLSLSLSQEFEIQFVNLFFCWWIAYSKCLTKWFRLGLEKNTLINKCCTASMAEIVP